VNDPFRPLLELRSEGLFARAFGAFLDPPAPVSRAVLSHAHSDHAVAGHGEVWATPETLALYRRRNPDWSGTSREIRYGEEVREGDAVLRFHSAGHVLGSAQVWIGSGDESLLYTGDFKRRPARTTPPLEAPRATTLVTEATFGLPVFRFPDREEIERRLVEACRSALDDGETPVLLAYALGKAQESAAILAAAGIATVLHGAAWKLVPVYEAAGFPLPLSRAYETGPALPGEALVVPPNCARTPVVRKIRRRRVVYLSGWAIREAARAEFDADVLLPFSDHADFHDLLAHVEETGASRIVATHGFAADFARILAARGRDAAAIPETAERGTEDA
jgi:Cft2 family RNA processing exonuclease